MSAPTITRQAMLRRAAEILPVNQRCVGEYYEAHAGLAPAKCPVCPLGAIALAAGCDLDHMSLHDPMAGPEDLAMHTARALAEHLDLLAMFDNPDTIIRVISDWNDHDDRTDAEVLAALTATADALDQAEEAPNVH